MIRSTLGINGRTYSNSPTQVIRNDILNDLTGANAITTLNTIELVFSDGSTVDISAVFQRNGSELATTVSWTNNTGSDKTITKVRLKAGVKVYFETTVSSTVENGNTVNINAKVSVMLGSSDNDFDGGILNVEIAKRLSGERNQPVKLTKLQLLAWSDIENQYVLIGESDLSIDIDYTNSRATATAQYQHSGSDMLARVEGIVVNGVNPDISDAYGYALKWKRNVQLTSGSTYSFTFNINL